MIELNQRASNIVIHRRSSCRLCDSHRLELVVPQKPTPVSEKYITKEELHVVETRYPLDLYMCVNCGHVQLIDIVDPKFLFDTYTFKSSQTGGLVKHFDETAEEIIAHFMPLKGGLVVDIGSNDGALLKCFKQQGYRVLGVDPAKDIARQATASGIETLPEFMDCSVAKEIRKIHGPVTIVTAFNAFAHSDDLAQIADSIRELLSPDGIFVFEVSYLMDIIDRRLLGTIFHEHVSYHSLKPLVQFLDRHGLELIHVKRVTIQGGSLIGTVQLRGGKRGVDTSVTELLELEEKKRLHHVETLKNFYRDILDLKSQVCDGLKSFEKSGGLIAGFGAARSGTTLIAQMDLGEKIKFIVDDHPDKQNKFSPGDHIPIYPTAALYERKPACVFILAWIHAKKIMESHRRYLAEGGRFMVCFPKVSVYSE